MSGWIAEDDASDHWQRGRRGLIASRLIASRLIEQLTERGGDMPVQPVDGSLSQRLRARLNRE